MALSPRNGPSRRGDALPESEIRRLLDDARELAGKGDLGAARRSFEALLRAGPDFAPALNGMGNLALAAGRPDIATEWHRRAVRAQPKDPGLLNDLANSLILAGQPHEALPYLRKALDRAPRFLPALFNQVRGYRDLGESDRALSLLDKLTVITGSLGDAVRADATLERALVLVETGRGAEARPLFHEVLRVRPGDARAIDGLATCHKATESDNDLALIEKALSIDGLAPAHRARTLRAKGKVLEDIGRYDEAFAAFAQSNAVSPPFHMARHEAFVAGSIRTFTRQFLAARRSWGDPTRRPVFIIGLPRSGTTLVEQILASHPRVQGLGELPYIERALNAAVPEPWGSEGFFLRLSTLRDNEVRSHAKEVLRPIVKRGGTGDRLIDKMPHNFLVAGWIVLLFPNARMIHVQRDALDVCVSCYCHHFSAAHSYASDLATLGRYHRSYEQLMRHWSAVLPDNLLTVSYEALVHDLEGETRRMLQHLDLPWDDACLSFHATRRTVQTPSRWQVRQPIYGHAIGRWRRYERHLAPLIEALRTTPAQ